MKCKQFKIYIHKTCPTSLKLLEALERENLLDRVQIIDVEERPFAAINIGVVSVPIIECDGEVIDFGPIKIEDVVKMVKRGEILKEKPSIEDAVKKILRIIRDNLFLALNMYIRESPEFILESKALQSALNLDEEDVEAIRKYVKERREKIYEEVEEKLLRTIVRNLEMEITMLEMGKIFESEEILKEHIKHWIIARSSTARIGLIQPEKIDLDNKVEKILKKFKEFSKI